MPFRTVFFVGIALTLACVLLLKMKSNPSFGVDGKTYYVASRVLLEGGNPYSTVDMPRASREVDPNNFAVGGTGETMVNVPASLLVFVPFSLLPIKAFYWLMVLSITMSLPFVVSLSARLIKTHLTTASLVGITALAAIFPPFWRNVCVGQPTAPILLCLLAATLYCVEKRPWGLAGAGLLSLAKVTCAAPVLAWLFVKGDRAARLGLLAVSGVFVLLNLAIVAHIGVHSFLSGYRESGAALFNPNGGNDPYTKAMGQRIDTQALAALFVPRGYLDFLSTFLNCVLVLPLLPLLLRKNSSIGSSIMAVLLYSLFAMYHRLYDAVLAVPLLILIFRDYQIGDKAVGALRAFGFLFAAAVLGDHNILALHHTNSDAFIVALSRPLSVILMYLTVIFPELRQVAQGQAKAEVLEPTDPLQHAAAR